MYYVQYIYNMYYILTLSYCRPHGSWERCLGQLCPQKNPSSKQGCPVLLPRPTPGTEASYRRCTEATKQSPDVHALFQGIFLTQGSNLCLLWLLHCRWVLYL